MQLILFCLLNLTQLQDFPLIVFTIKVMLISVRQAILTKEIRNSISYVS